MHPPPIYPQLIRFHIHGVATSIPSKEKFEVCFLLKYLQNPLVIPKTKRQSWKQKRKEKEKYWKKREKAPKVSHEKGMSTVREKKNISTSNLLVWVHFLSYFPF
jgi:hypothetical protein